MDTLSILSGITQNMADQQQTMPQLEPTTEAHAETSDYLDGLAESVDNIFAAVIVGGIDRSNTELLRQKHEVFKQAQAKFKSMYSQNVFINEYAFFHSVITSLKIPVFSWAQLDIIINNSADDILTSERIDLSSFATFNGVASTDEEKLEAFKYLIKAKFDSLSNKAVTLDEYESACKIYNACYKEDETMKLINDMAIIMTSGLSKKVGPGRKRIWKGANDAQEYYRRRKAEIDSIDETEGKIRSTTIDEKWLSGQLEHKKTEDNEPLIDTGIIEIDSIHGPLHRGNMLEFLGPTKGGKTTLTTYMVERCLAAGLNVAIWPLEGTQEEWNAGIISAMIRKKGRLNVNKKDILERNFATDEDYQLFVAAETELAMGENRGHLSYIEGICYVEDMIDTLTDHYNKDNAFDVIVIDSPLLALSNTGKSKPDRIGECFTILKNFINNKLPRKALALVTAQLKQAIIDELRKNPTMEIPETAGGESAETIRTPDYVVCLVSTKEERQNKLAKLHDVAVRHTAPFKPFYLRAEFGCCHFYSDPGLNAV